jgi:hypothetical protein
LGPQLGPASCAHGLELPDLDPADNRLVGPTSWAHELGPRAGRVGRAGPTSWVHEPGPTSPGNRIGSRKQPTGPRSRAREPGPTSLGKQIWIARTTDWAYGPSPRARAHEPGSWALLGYPMIIPGINGVPSCRISALGAPTQCDRRIHAAARRPGAHMPPHAAPHGRALMSHISHLRSEPCDPSCPKVAFETITTPFDCRALMSHKGSWAHEPNPRARAHMPGPTSPGLRHQIWV